MEPSHILGYISALAVGIVLGLIGGGGSILTVPILVYLFYLHPVTATAYSLFVVGVSALVGTLRNIPKGLVDFKTAIVFAIPAFTTVYLTRKFLVHSIPEKLFTVNGFMVTNDIAIMTFFALIMFIASISMIKSNGKKTVTEASKNQNYPVLIIEGVLIGLLTGMVGAGGGFLIIPALVLLAKLPMKKAVATSLFIIAVNSLIGFIGDVENIDIDWTFLLSFSAIAVVGIFVGVWLNKFIDGKKLKKSFGWFVLVMALYIIFKEFS